MPAAPPASPAPSTVRIIDSGPPKPPPSPTREIRASSLMSSSPPAAKPPPASKPPITGAKPTPEAPAKPSERGSFYDRLAKSATTGEHEPEITPTPVQDPPAESDPNAEPERTEPGPEPAPEPQKPAAEIDPKTGKPKKANPWKLRDEERAARIKVEQEFENFKKNILPDQDRTQLTERLTKAEARAKELEDHIRYVDYQQSSDFKEKFEQPYVDAWQAAFSDLAEIPINDPVQGPRAVTEADMWDIINLSLPEATRVAKEAFGEDFYQTVLGHRKEIKKMLGERNKALENAKKTGGERIKQLQDQRQAQTQAVAKEVSAIHKELTDVVMNDPKNGQYFKPIPVKEGDHPTPEVKEWNESLEAGYDLAQKAWTQNPLERGITPEEKRRRIEQHVAAYNRIAAFGPLKRKTLRLEATIKRLEGELSQYQESTPGAGGSQSNGRPTAQPSGFDSLRARLQKVAT